MRPEPGSRLYHAANALARIDNYARYVGEKPKPKAGSYLSIRGEIGVGKEVNAKDILARVRTIIGFRAKSLDIVIDSPGGNVVEAEKIYNILRSFKGPVSIRVFGLCASAACICLMAGSNREAGAKARFCLHESSLNPDAFPVWEGNSRWTGERHAAMAKLLSDTNLSHAKLYARHTGHKEQEFIREMKAERIINSSRALELGLIHRVLDTSGITGDGLA